MLVCWTVYACLHTLWNNRRRTYNPTHTNRENQMLGKNAEFHVSACRSNERSYLSRTTRTMSMFAQCCLWVYLTQTHTHTHLVTLNPSHAHYNKSPPYHMRNSNPGTWCVCTFADSPSVVAFSYRCALMKRKWKHRTSNHPQTTLVRAFYVHVKPLFCRWMERFVLNICNSLFGIVVGLLHSDTLISRDKTAG